MDDILQTLVIENRSYFELEIVLTNLITII